MRDEELNEMDLPVSKSYYDWHRSRLNELRASIASHALSDEEKSKAKTEMEEIDEFLAYKEEHELVESKDPDLELRD